MKKHKSQMIYARVTDDLKKLILAAAEARGETEAIILREALREYFARREIYSIHNKIKAP